MAPPSPLRLFSLRHTWAQSFERRKFSRTGPGLPTWCFPGIIRGSLPYCNPVIYEIYWNVYRIQVSYIILLMTDMDAHPSTHADLLMLPGLRFLHCFFFASRVNWKYTGGSRLKEKHEKEYQHIQQTSNNYKQEESGCFKLPKIGQKVASSLLVKSHIFDASKSPCGVAVFSTRISLSTPIKHSAKSPKGEKVRRRPSVRWRFFRRVHGEYPTENWSMFHREKYREIPRKMMGKIRCFHQLESIGHDQPFQTWVT